MILQIIFCCFLAHYWPSVIERRGEVTWRTSDSQLGIGVAFDFSHSKLLLNSIRLGFCKNSILINLKVKLMGGMRGVTLVL